MAGKDISKLARTSFEKLLTNWLGGGMLFCKDFAKILEKLITRSLKMRHFFEKNS